jgi:hypothetical protein
MFVVCLILFFIVSITIIGFSLYIGISPMPTSSRVKNLLFANLPQIVEGIIYELGSGWGTLAMPLARVFPQCTIQAIEISPIPWLISKIFGNFYSNLILKRKNFFDLTLEDASLVVCYLYPKAMKQLKYKFEKELPKGCFVISNTFAIPGWIPLSTLTADDFYRSRIYIYKVE